MTIMVERLLPHQIGIAGGSEEDVERFIESDFRIRSGLCPNGCGLLASREYGQECPGCKFSTNTMPESKPND